MTVFYLVTGYKIKTKEKLLEIHWHGIQIFFNTFERQYPSFLLVCCSHFSVFYGGKTYLA